MSALDTIGQDRIVLFGEDEVLPAAGRPAADRIASLDAVKDCREIALLLSSLEFSWDIERALEFALFRTYAVPSISGLLARTGEFESRPRKRYDDTELILAEIIENGFDSDRGRRALARMNDMHGRFRIAESDLLYVLSTFVFEPIRWLERYGRRPMTAHEQKAWFRYYRRLGERMGIAGIPDELEEFRRFNERYEAEHFRFAESNKAVATATSDLLLGFYLPSWLLWAGRPVVRAIMDPPLVIAMGFAPAPAWLRGGSDEGSGLGPAATTAPTRAAAADASPAPDLSGRLPDRGARYPPPTEPSRLKLGPGRPRPTLEVMSERWGTGGA